MSERFCHPLSVCESPNIGKGTRIWAFAHVLPGAFIGEDCNICDHVFIENDVVVGDRVTVKCGVQLWDGLRIGNDVFIGPNATFTNDRFPRSKQYQDKILQTIIGDGASIGANATILPGLSIGKLAMVAAGAVVTRNVPPRAIVVGNPARVTGYVDTPRRSSGLLSPDLMEGSSVTESRVKGVTIHRLKQVNDARGNLAVGNFMQEVPFAPKRFFLVFDVPAIDVRGEHAHRTCSQFLVCVNGTMSLIVHDGAVSEEIELNNPALGVFVPPMVWACQYKYSHDAVLLVYASEAYDPLDYIRSFDEFLSVATRGGSA